MRQCTVPGPHSAIADILDSIGDPISHRDQLETILDGLLTEYQALMSIIRYRDDPCPMIVAETMLLPHEATLDMENCTPIHEPLYVNLTQGNMTPLPNSDLIASQEAQSQVTSQEFSQQSDGSHGVCGGRFSNFRGSGGRNGGRTHIQCQISFKIGHDARICYHLHFLQPSSSLSATFLFQEDGA